MKKILKYLIITQENVEIFQILYKYSYLKNFTKFLPCIKVVTCQKKTNSQISLSFNSRVTDA